MSQSAAAATYARTCAAVSGLSTGLTIRNSPRACATPVRMPAPMPPLTSWWKTRSVADVAASSSAIRPVRSRLASSTRMISYGWPLATSSRSSAASAAASSGSSSYAGTMTVRSSPTLASPRSSTEVVADRGADVVDLLLGQLGVHRQRQPLARAALRVGKAPLLDPEEVERPLAMDRDGVVPPGLDAALAQGALKPVAVGVPDHVEVVDVPTRRANLGGHDHAGPGQPRAVPRRVSLPRCVPRVE